MCVGSLVECFCIISTTKSRTISLYRIDDIDKAEAVLTKLVTEHPLVLADPAPVVKLNELADSSVNFVVRPWTKTGDYWTVYWDLVKGVKQAFDREGISIPFPQQDVHIHQA